MDRSAASHRLLQHPGNGDVTLSYVPRLAKYPVPKDATIVITRRNGGIIGTQLISPLTRARTTEHETSMANRHIVGDFLELAAALPISENQHGPLSFHRWIEEVGRCSSMGFVRPVDPTIGKGMRYRFVYWFSIV